MPLCYPIFTATVFAAHTYICVEFYVTHTILDPGRQMVRWNFTLLGYLQWIWTSNANTD